MAKNSEILNVNGMSCGHCENKVKTAVKALNGIDSVSVSLEDKKVTVEYDPNQVTIEHIKETIENQGYDVV